PSLILLATDFDPILTQSKLTKSFPFSDCSSLRVWYTDLHLYNPFFKLSRKLTIPFLTFCPSLPINKSFSGSNKQ
ncbi:MAG TPA: hypothetical protein VJ583_09915, partial [Nitrososphaeraceae archaeon]|nr:hypothetical protein [Nitrososphaeraceae archaeon]